jgi:hypothetical protein
MIGDRFRADHLAVLQHFSERASWNRRPDEFPNLVVLQTFSKAWGMAALSNWSGGGENALSLNSYLDLYANYQREKISWNNDLRFAYGLLSRGKVLEKTDDKIRLSSTFGYALSEKWNYSADLGLKTQMMPGYAKDTVRVSAFAAPAYVMLSTGAEFTPHNKFHLLFAPLSGKMTVVADSALSAQGAYGVDPGKRTRSEVGGYVKISFRHELFENVNLQTTCDLFMNYIARPVYVDVDWSFLLTMKINKFLSASIDLRMIYDHDYSEDLQFKETLGLGVTFSF